MEYMAACMDDRITASEHWRNELFDEALDAIHENPNLSKAYAFMFNECIYESTAKVVSLHWTKAGAYRAMNDYLNERWTRGMNEPRRKRDMGIGYKPFQARYEWWGIKEFPILP